MTRYQKEIKQDNSQIKNIKNEVAGYQSLTYFSNRELVKELQTRVKKRQVLVGELDNLPNNLHEVSNLSFLKELSERVNKEGTLFFVYTEQERKTIAEWLKLTELDEADKLCHLCHKQEIYEGERLFCPSCWEIEKKRRVDY